MTNKGVTVAESGATEEKKDLVEIVELVYAMWNKELPNGVDARKMVYRAWSRILKGLPKDGVINAAERLSIREQFLPTPGMLKAEYLRTQPDAPPAAAQAWNEYCRIREQVHSGATAGNLHVHPRLQETIRQVGMNLHTNDDRRHFTETYTTIINTPTVADNR